MQPPRQPAPSTHHKKVAAAGGGVEAPGGAGGGGASSVAVGVGSGSGRSVVRFFVSFFSRNSFSSAVCTSFPFVS